VLVLCPTPIGNLEDVTLRTLTELREADLVLCEDTRRTRVLLERHGIRASLVSFHAHNEARRTAEVLPRLEAGDRVAVVSDAGLPGVNDPGARLLAAAIGRGLDATVLPGPSAVETALVASGLVAERYTFLGYLPRSGPALAHTWEEVAGWTWPVVAFESPRRLPRSLAALAAVAPERPAAVCRELTKRFEEIVRGSAAELAARFREPPKGEITLVVGAALRPAAGGADDAEAVRAVAELVAAGASRRAAADVVARLTGASRNRLYRDSL
jgi:16S rRNA (cytidine1402-2'-O)-methyltransferase